jgi:hypothetical protein
VKGVQFLWANVVGSVEQARSDSRGAGCILAHEMGLGKTFQARHLRRHVGADAGVRQAIAFLQAVHAHTPLRRLLVLVPVNCMENWGLELHAWLAPQHRMRVYSQLVLRHARQRAAYFGRWHAEVCLIAARERESGKGGAERCGCRAACCCSATRCTASWSPAAGPTPPPSPPRWLTRARTWWCGAVGCGGGGWWLTARGKVVDEGHRIKNSVAGLNKALTRIRTLCAPLSLCARGLAV